MEIGVLIERDRVLVESMRSIEEMRLLNEAPPRGERRSLSATILVPEVKIALAAFAECLQKFPEPWVVIGGVSLGAYTRPRTTVDVDVVLLSDSLITGMVRYLTPVFKQNRPHSFVHKATGVDVEVVTPDWVEIAPALVSKILATAESDSLNGVSIRVASLEGMLASKLVRAKRQDQADIEALIKAQGAPDLSAWPLTEKERALYAEIAGSV